MDISVDDLSRLTEGRDLEIKAGLGQDRRGQLPKAFWETYSAMANCDGGVILLGIAEEPRGSFHAVGLREIGRVQKALWDGLNDRDQVSINLLAPPMVEEITIGHLPVLKVSVPRAKRAQRPVYVGRNPLTGTFQRRFEGDYRCDAETVRRMLAESVEDERDSRLLPGYTLDDLDPASLRAYRNRVKVAKPDLPWHSLDDRAFLQALGAFKRDRDTGAEGLTVGGLLMLGKLPAIQEAVPYYMLDYQEHPDPTSDERWLDRLTPDGDWSGNLFDFFRLVLQKLYAGVPVPFQLSGAARVDQSSVHEALREALVNTLIHADFTGRASILVVKRPDLYGFRNPGSMRVPLEDALQGGHSDCRNRVLQRLFRMAGYAEQAGTGIHRIYSAWAAQLWRAPLLQETRDDPETTFLTMTMVSLLSNDTIAKLEGRFGPRFHSLTTTQKMALATVAVESRVSHARLKTMVYEHPRDISAALSWLCREGFLDSAGVARGTYYFFRGEPPVEAPSLFDSPAVPRSEQTGLRSEQTGLRSEQMEPRSEQMEPRRSEQTLNRSGQESRSSEEWERLQEVARPIRECKKVSSRQQVDAVILELCAAFPLSLSDLQVLLGRAPDSLRVHYLNRLSKEGRIRLRFAETVNHPQQAYMTVRDSIPEGGR
jgi:ATP-dependent DNA helicase RecG